VREQTEHGRENVSVSREKERAAMAAALLPLQQLQVQQPELGVEFE